MTVRTSRFSANSRLKIALVAVGTLRLIWNILRLPLMALFVIAEPAVRVLLLGIAAAGLLTAIFLELSGAAPHFSMSAHVAISLGCLGLLFVYYVLMRAVSR